MDFLSEIIAVKRQCLAAAKLHVTFDQIRDGAYRVRASAGPHRLADALRDDSRINIIAEFKRCSPSKGKINSDADPQAVARMYELGGAAAVSVLTEEDYFDGSLEDLRRIRESVSLPLLRKDFVVDDYQVYESAAAGADALLLIVAALDDHTLKRLRGIAEDELGMDALIEVHARQELDRAVACGARLIGINNRDLRTFEVAVATSELLARAAPRGSILVSESGLNAAEILRLRDIGFRGFLVGESLMRAADPVKAIEELTDQRQDSGSKRVWVKICGITNLEDARAAIDAGADMLGFNFYRPSPRFIEPKAAAEIIHRIRSQSDSRDQSMTMIGVFVNETIDEILRIADEACLNGVQLHGEETVEFCTQLKKMSPQRFVIKAMRPDAEFSVKLLSGYPADAVMIDALDTDLRGGTGRLADWGIASDAAQKLPRLFLAGGLAPDNVAEAIATVRPYAVDACSSLETAPGKKSAKRVKEFVEAVRSSKLQDETSIAGEGN